MQNNFIKLTTGLHDEILINPTFICSIKKLGHTNKVTIYTMDHQSFIVNEPVDVVLKRIKEAGMFHFDITKSLDK